MVLFYIHIYVTVFKMYFYNKIVFYITKHIKFLYEIPYSSELIRSLGNLSFMISYLLELNRKTKKNLAYSKKLVPAQKSKINFSRLQQNIVQK